MLDILDRLVAFPSVSSASNLDIIDYCQDFLTQRGFQVHRLTSDDGDKAGLFASIGPAGDGVMLSAHTDVVPVEGQDWTRPPFRLAREGDRLFGRGTTDMKGYLACMLAAADRAAGMTLTEPLKLALSWDEEVGCVGMRDMIGALRATVGPPRLCLVGEPTEMQVATGHKGKVALRALCHGQSGHSALAPRFVNALHPASDFVSGLAVLQSELAEHGARDAAYDVPYSTVHAGRFTGGGALNIVPDRAEILFEIRHLAEDRAEDLLDRIRTLADGIAACYRPRFDAARIEITQTNAYPGLTMDPAAPEIGLVQRLAHSNGTIKVPYGTEAGFFHGIGVATLVCGPGSMEGQGHKPDEFIALSQLDSCQRMLNRLLDDMAAPDARALR